MNTKMRHKWPTFSFSYDAHGQKTSQDCIRIVNTIYYCIAVIINNYIFTHHLSV